MANQAGFSCNLTGSPKEGLLKADAGKQPPEGDNCPEEAAIPMFPLSAALCVGCTALTASAMVVVLWFGGISERSYEHSPDVVWHSKCSIVLIIQAGIMELCILMSSWLAAGIATPELRPKPQSDNVLQKHNNVDSALTLLEYAVKLLTSCYLAQTDGVTMHVNPLLPFTRPIYLVRYVQWALAVPVLMLLSNRAFLAMHGDTVTLRRSAPGMVVSSLYCIASWVMEVTPLNWGQCLLWALILISFLAACIDQICLACSAPDVTARRMKFGLLAYQIVAYVLYTGVYMAGYFGCITAATEQYLYCYMDATVKVFQGCVLAMIRNYEDLRLMKHWWLESVVARRDFERLVKQARVPIFAMDLQGRVTKWNESLTNLTGFAADKVLGLKAEEIICAESHEYVQQALSRALAVEQEAAGPVEIWVKRSLPDAAQKGNTAETKPINLVISFVPRITQEGAVDGIVAIGQDVSELSELKAVEQKKGQLMAVVSHELRSPLHGMIGLTNMLEQQIQGASFKRQLKMVRCCAQRLLDLVTNIMDLTEAEQRQRKAAPEMKQLSLVNMLEVAQEVTVMTSMAMDKSGKPLVGPELKLVNAMGELREFPFVLGDPYKCTRLLYNLVTNACKFTHKGSVTLKARHVKEKRLLEVDVEDTGVGIADEAQQRIFQPFEQERTSHVDSRSYQGMGLGLSVCFSIAHAHGGSIRVQSKVGMGSTFTVALPCEETFVNRSTEDEGLIASVMSQNEQWASKQYAAKKAGRGDIQGQQQPTDMHAAPVAADSDSSSPPTADRADASRRTPIILSVDDDEVNQEVIQNALGEQYNVIRAMSGNEALDHLERCTKACSTEEAETMRFPDLILLDIQMPGLTGFDVLKELRGKYTSAHTKLPVIMVSAKAPMEVAALRSYSDGCSDFLAKPFSTGILKAKIAVLTEIKKESTGSGPAKEAKMQVEQVEAKAQQAAEEAAAARGEAKAAKKRAAIMEQELSKVQKELEQARAAQAAAEENAAGCSAAMEQKVSEIQKDLEEARMAVGAALEKGQKAPAVYGYASAEIASSNCSESAGSRSSPLELHPKAQPMRWASEPTLWTPPKMHLPLTAPGGVDGTRALVPWLYRQIQEREDEIVNLNGQLAAHRSASELVARQMELVKQAAMHSRSILQPCKSH